METLGNPGVTLLNYIPLNDDGYANRKSQEAQNYLESVPDTGSSCNYAAQAISYGASSTNFSTQGSYSCSTVSTGMAAALENSTPAGVPRKMPPPYEYIIDNFPAEHLPSPYCGDAMQLSPAPRNCVDCIELSKGTYDAASELRMMGTNDTILDIGPPPASLPRLDRPLSVDVRELSSTNYPCHGSRGSSLGPHSSPQNPMITDSFYRKFGQRNRNKIPQNIPLRSSSPMFPDQSTPLSDIGRQSNMNSSTLSSKASEKYNTVSSVNSDSGIYSIYPSRCNSAINSPSVFPMDQESPAFDFTVTKSQPEPTSSKHFIELEVPSKHAKRISELDKKILKLQAERSKIMERLHQTKQSGTTISNLDQYEMDFLYTEKPIEMGKVKLYIYPLGINDLDEPLYDEGNRLLRKVGGLYLDLQAAVSAMRNICCKGVFLLADISTCFSYIKSLLPEEQKLSLLKAEGTYSIQLDQCEGDVSMSHGTEFFESLEAANRVLRCSQLITLSYNSIQTDLRKARELAKEKIDAVDKVFQQYGLADRERPTIRAVLEGNHVTMASAERVWPQYYQVASDTISMITECIHPSQAT